MRSMRKLFGGTVAVVVLASAGCAPVASTWHAGPGLRVGMNPSGNLRVANPQCSLMASPGLGGSPFSTISAASTVMARMQQVARIQWSLMSGNQSGPGNMASWKSIAGGGC